MKYWIPGYWEWVSKRHIQSVLIFALTVFSILSILKSSFFSEVPNPQGMRVWGSLFFFCALWHGMFVVFFSTEAVLTGGSFDEWYERARLASLKGNTDLALFYFERMHQKAPQDEDVTYQLGKVYMELGRTRQAKKLFRKYLSGPDAKWKREVEALMEEGVRA